MTDLEFLASLNERGVGIYDRAIAFLWWVGRDDPTSSLTARELCTSLEKSGLPTQNVSRLNARLAADRRVSKAGKSGGWRLHPRSRSELSSEYLQYARVRPKDTGSVIPTELVATRAYLRKVVQQLNASYDAHLFDCCAVMCRRLLETLLIEVYEHAGRESEIKGSDGHYLTLNGLVTHFEQNSGFSLSRIGLHGAVSRA